MDSWPGQSALWHGEHRNGGSHWVRFGVRQQAAAVGKGNLLRPVSAMRLACSVPVLGRRRAGHGIEGWACRYVEASRLGVKGTASSTGQRSAALWLRISVVGAGAGPRPTCLSPARWPSDSIDEVMIWEQ